MFQTSITFHAPWTAELRVWGETVLPIAVAMQIMDADRAVSLATIERGAPAYPVKLTSVYRNRETGTAEVEYEGYLRKTLKGGSYRNGPTQPKAS